MINVDGFLFEDEETAQLARKEEDGIRFIKQRTALDNPEVSAPNSIVIPRTLVDAMFTLQD